MANVLEICRICMNINVKMYTFKNTNIENLYNLLTQAYVDIGDGKPTTVCFLCYARLRQCERLQRQAVKSNVLLEQLLRGGFMQATANAILNSRNTNQDLQVSSIYQLDLEPTTCRDVTLDATVEAMILIKEEEAVDKGYNVSDFEPATCEDLFLDPTLEANNLISIKEEKETIDERYNVTGFSEDANDYIDFDYEAIKSDPEVDQLSIEVVSHQSDGIKDVADGKERRKRREIENLCIIKQEKEIKKYSRPSNSIQILKTEKSSHKNEINMKSIRNVRKKNGTITTIANFQKPLNYNEVDKKSYNILAATKTYVVPHEQRIQKSINDEDTKEENINNPHTSVINTKIGEFQCNECGKQFSTKDILTNHILKCMKTTESLLIDSQLKRADMFKSLLSLTHLKMHNVSKILSCNICEYRCLHKHHLKDHMRTHTGEKSFSCNICEYRCSRKHHLKDHMRTHTGEEPFSCNICKYRFVQKYDLKRHITTHTGEKPFSCNICDYWCVQKGDLKKHMIKHSGEKPYSCNICDYRCVQKSDLQKHMRKHTGEKPFSCNICEYRCAIKSNLIGHIRTHTGEKPISCNICEYRCSYKHHLKNHMRTHTGEKPFSCNICEYKSTQKVHLKSHLRTHN